MELSRLSLHHTDVTKSTSVQATRRAVLSALLSFGFLAFGVGAITARTLETRPLTFIKASGERLQITVEVADDDEKRATGLMFRRSIGDDEGMIFIYPQEEQIAMWMKNTYISLDMFFLRADGTIIRIERNTEPFSERTITSGGLALGVIEMKAGSAERLGIKVGDIVDFPSFK